MSAPTKPSLGLLMSMAIRYDHGLGVPGFYNQLFYKREGITHAQRLESTISQMSQLYEEVAGTGFYKPDREAAYVEIYERSVK